MIISLLNIFFLLIGIIGHVHGLILHGESALMVSTVTHLSLQVHRGNIYVDSFSHSNKVMDKTEHQINNYVFATSLIRWHLQVAQALSVVIWRMCTHSCSTMQNRLWFKTVSTYFFEKSCDDENESVMMFKNTVKSMFLSILFFRSSIRAV